VLTVEQFGQDQVGPGLERRSRPHRGAEAGRCGGAALHGDQQQVPTVGGVHLVLGQALEEHPVLHRDRGHLAGMQTEEGQAGRGALHLDDLEVGVVARLSGPQRLTRREQGAFRAGWSDGEAEVGVVVAPDQPVGPG
jgi:hypothetical protein